MKGLAGGRLSCLFQICQFSSPDRKVECSNLQYLAVNANFCVILSSYPRICNIGRHFPAEVKTLCHVFYSYPRLSHKI